jgi:hypothetical protein
MRTAQCLHGRAAPARQHGCIAATRPTGGVSPSGEILRSCRSRKPLALYASYVATDFRHAPVRCPSATPRQPVRTKYTAASAEAVKLLHHAKRCSACNTAKIDVRSYDRKIFLLAVWASDSGHLWLSQNLSVACDVFLWVACACENTRRARRRRVPSCLLRHSSSTPTSTSAEHEKLASYPRTRNMSRIRKHGGTQMRIHLRMQIKPWCAP